MTRQQSETEKALRAEFPDADSQAWIDHCFGECDRGEGGRALAVKLKCLDCCGWQRAEVRDCRVATCPLWHWRPFQRDEEE